MSRSEELPGYLAGRQFSIYQDDRSKWRTKSLFWELVPKQDRAAFQPLYTLYEEDIERDGVTYPSLKKIYMSYDHIPGAEWEFANEHLGGWEHWEILATSSMKQIKAAIASWRKEMEIKHKAMAIKSMIKSAKEDGAKGLSAAKYLADKGYLSQRGRPSKEEVERERKLAANISSEMEEDLARIQLTLVK